MSNQGYITGTIIGLPTITTERIGDNHDGEWLLCDGRHYDPKQYPALDLVLKNATILPDLRGSNNRKLVTTPLGASIYPGTEMEYYIKASDGKSKDHGDPFSWKKIKLRRIR